MSVTIADLGTIQHLVETMGRSSGIRTRRRKRRKVPLERWRRKDDDDDVDRGTAQIGGFTKLDNKETRNVAKGDDDENNNDCDTLARDTAFEIQLWLRQLDQQGRMLRYGDAIIHHFDNLQIFSQVMVSVSLSSVNSVDPGIWQALECDKMGHRCLLLQGIQTLQRRSTS